MNPIEQYIHDRDEQVRKNLEDRDLQVNTSRYTEELVRTNYTKNFTWMGIPILQYPSDLMVIQELIWQIKPDFIFEIGIAFGGMTVFYAGILDVIGHGTVFGIDIEIRKDNRRNIRHHPCSNRIELIEKNSIDPEFVKYMKPACKGKNVLVSLDSLHTHNHVLQELRLYAPLVSVGSYIVVFDTAIEFFGHLDKNQDRPWSKGNNPWTAVQEFMQNNDEFVVDRKIEQRALITAAVDGFLRRIK